MRKREVLRMRAEEVEVWFRVTCCLCLSLRPPDCELVALLEDDTGMELLVCNKIISLDLPVKDVFKKIWCAQPNVRSSYACACMHAYTDAQMHAYTDAQMHAYTCMYMYVHKCTSAHVHVSTAVLCVVCP